MLGEAKKVTKHFWIGISALFLAILIASITYSDSINRSISKVYFEETNDFTSIVFEFEKSDLSGLRYVVRDIKEPPQLFVVFFDAVQANIAQMDINKGPIVKMIPYFLEKDGKKYLDNFYIHLSLASEYEIEIQENKFIIKVSNKEFLKHQANAQKESQKKADIEKAKQEELKRKEQKEHEKAEKKAQEKLLKEQEEKAEQERVLAKEKAKVEEKNRKQQEERQKQLDKEAKIKAEDEAKALKEQKMVEEKAQKKALQEQQEKMEKEKNLAEKKARADEKAKAEALEEQKKREKKEKKLAEEKEKADRKAQEKSKKEIKKQEILSEQSVNKTTQAKSTTDEDVKKNISQSSVQTSAPVELKPTETYSNAAVSTASVAENESVKKEKPSKKKWPSPPWIRFPQDGIPEQAIPLTLEQCIHIARLNSLGIRIAQEDILLARWKVGAAKRGLWPSFDALYKSTSGTTGGQDYTGREMTLEFQQPLYTAGKQTSLLKQAWINHEISERNYQKEVAELDFKVQQAYFILVNSYRDVEFLYKLKEDVQRDLRVSEERYNLDLSREIELLKVQTKLIDINYRISAAEKDLDLAELTLKQVVNTQNDIPFYVKANLNEYEVTVSLDQCVEMALEHRSDLLVSELLIDYNRYGKKIADSEYKWGLNLEGSIGMNDEAFDTEELSLEQEHFVGLKANKVIGPHTFENNFMTQDKVPAVGQTTSTKFSSNTTKFYFWNSQARINMKEADIKYLKAIDEFDKKQNSIIFEIRKGYFEYIKSREQYYANKEKLKLSEQELVVAKAREMLNETLISDTLDAKDKLSRSQIDLGQSLSSYYTSIANLNKAIGLTSFFDVKRGVEDQVVPSERWVLLVNDQHGINATYRGMHGWDYFVAGIRKNWKRWKWKRWKPPKEVTTDQRYEGVPDSASNVELKNQETYVVPTEAVAENASSVDSAISVDSNLPKEEQIDLWLKYGKEAYQNKKFNQAVNCWQEVLKLDPENKNAQKYIERAKSRDTKSEE